MNTTRSLLITALVLAAIPGVAARQHAHPAAPQAPTAAALKQIEEVRRSTEAMATTDGARASGYEPVLGWIPMMGTHWVNGPRMLKGRAAVTLGEPSQLMFSAVDGKQTLVGVAYAYYGDPKETAQPVLFDGAPAWHDHPDLSPPGTNLFMLHAWLVDSPDGPFAGFNPFLPYWAAGVAPPSLDRMRDHAFAIRARKAALALAEIVEPKGLFPILARRPAVQPVLDEHRTAIRAVVPQLNAAKTARNLKAWDTLVDTLGVHFDAMRQAYLASALDPNVRARIAKAMDDMINGGHSH